MSSLLPHHLLTVRAGCEESPGVAGLGVIPSAITRFTVDTQEQLAVPHIGWNGANVRHASGVLGAHCEARFYFVHRFAGLRIKKSFFIFIQ